MPVTINGTTGVVTPGATIGSINGILKSSSGVVSQAVAGTDYLTPTSGGSITLDTAQTASGTAVDFTGIPSWVKRITVMFNNVSTSSTNAPVLQIGPGTSPETSGYTGYSVTHGGVGISYHGYSAAYSSDIKLFATTWADAYPLTGKVVLDLLDATTNTWVVDGMIVIIGNTNTETTIVGAKALASALGMVRITINGTDTFDAGKINISYE